MIDYDAIELRSKLLGSLLFFTQFFFRLRTGRDFIVSKPDGREAHVISICRSLTKVFDGDTTRLKINIPPRYSKTELMIHFVAWSLAHYPDSNFIYVSYSHNLAAKQTSIIRDIISMPHYKRLFDVVISDTTAAKDNFETTAGGSVYGVGAGGTITGRGAGLRSSERFGGCFPYYQEVETEEGPIKIGDIVNKKIPVKVWCLNEGTNKRELRKINNYYCNGSNDLIRVKMSDGSSFTCTPDHEILTAGGWVCAIHLAKSLNLAKAQPGSSACLGSGNTSVYSNFDGAFSVLWSCVPLGIRQVICDLFPSLSKLYLPNCGTGNVVSFCNDGSVLKALEYFNNLFSSEFYSGSSFEDWECPVPNGVLHVVGLTAIREIAKVIVGGVAVQMPNLVLMGSFTYKLLSDKVRNMTLPSNSVDGEANSEITFGGPRKLNKSNGLCPFDEPGIRNLIKPFGASNIFPVAVEYVGHVDETYCLEIDVVNNFELSHSGVIVTNCFIMDDMHKPDEAQSDVMREAVIDWYDNTAQSRMNNGDKTPQIIIGQRVHEDDLPARMTEQKGWSPLVIPALDVNNNPLDPVMHDRDALFKMRDTMPYVFAAQYQQDPQPAGGGLFKTEWFHLVDETPNILATFITVDTAETDKTYNDATAFSFWGLYKIVQGNVETDLYGLHWINAVEIWVEPKDLKDEFMAFYMECMMFHVKPKQAVIEKKSTGTTLVSVLKDMQGLQVIDLNRSVGVRNKMDRFLEIQQYIASKRISLPRLGKHTNMCLDHCKKITANNTHARDDLADTLSDAVKIALIDQTMIYRNIKTVNNETTAIVKSMANDFNRVQRLRSAIQW